MEQCHASQRSIATLILQNTQTTRAAITDLLEKTLQTSGHSPPAGMNEKVQQIAREAQHLAMQFGLNAAQLRFHVPSPREEVRIGSEVHDCEDGDSDRGAKLIVDLVTLPGLQIIGNVYTRTLVPCEIYPQQ
jgi:hypothetical protein